MSKSGKRVLAFAQASGDLQTLKNQSAGMAQQGSVLKAQALTQQLQKATLNQHAETFSVQTPIPLLWTSSMLVKSRSPASVNLLSALQLRSKQAI